MNPQAESIVDAIICRKNSRTRLIMHTLYNNQYHHGICKLVKRCRLINPLI